MWWTKKIICLSVVLLFIAAGCVKGEQGWYKGPEDKQEDIQIQAPLDSGQEVVPSEGPPPDIVPEPETPNWIKVSAGSSHTCAITIDKKLYCWGDNKYGQLGIGLPVDYMDKPAWVSDSGLSGSYWESVNSGNRHTCAIRGPDGYLYCWGENHKGALGNGTTTDKNVPIAVTISGAAKPGWLSVAAASAYTCGIRKPIGSSVASLLCWGQNDVGQVGINDTSRLFIMEPTEVFGGGDWKEVSAIGPHACAINQDDQLFCWGENFHGQIGNGQSGWDKNVYAPTRIEGYEWSFVSAGVFYTCGVRDDNTLWCWGMISPVYLGAPSTASLMSPRQVYNDVDWISVATGRESENTLCGIKKDNGLWCWGFDDWGQVGDGENTGTPPSIGPVPSQVTAPVQILNGNKWAAVTMGNSHTCGLTLGGNLMCWGDNLKGQLGDDTTETRYEPVVIGKPSS